MVRSRSSRPAGTQHSQPMLAVAVGGFQAMGGSQLSAVSAQRTGRPRSLMAAPALVGMNTGCREGAEAMIVAGEAEPEEDGEGKAGAEGARHEGDKQVGQGSGRGHDPPRTWKPERNTISTAMPVGISITG